MIGRFLLTPAKYLVFMYFMIMNMNNRLPLREKANKHPLYHLLQTLHKLTSSSKERKEKMRSRQSSGMWWMEGWLGSRGKLGRQWYRGVYLKYVSIQSFWLIRSSSSLFTNITSFCCKFFCDWKFKKTSSEFRIRQWYTINSIESYSLVSTQWTIWYMGWVQYSMKLLKDWQTIHFKGNLNYGT